MSRFTANSLLMVFDTKAAGEEGPKEEKTFAFFSPADLEEGFFYFLETNLTSGVGNILKPTRIPAWWMVEDIFNQVLRWATGNYGADATIVGDRESARLKFDLEAICGPKQGQWRALAPLAIKYGEVRSREDVRAFTKAYNRYTTSIGLTKRLQVVDRSNHRRRTLVVPTSTKERSGGGKVEYVDGLVGVGQIGLAHDKDGYYFNRDDRLRRRGEEENPYWTAEELVAMATKMAGHKGLSSYAPTILEGGGYTLDQLAKDPRVVEYLNTRDPWCPFLPPLLKPDDQLPVSKPPRTKLVMLREAIPPSIHWTRDGGDPEFRRMVEDLARSSLILTPPAPPPAT